ncbi:undecaprenyl diphosphate synthase family protein, partial [Candidatus Uhrbacteria bacterium]|nr:undecaprenyl diphosphate synthase family protein [Candidatus Uhrbacteria bacterium]
CLNYGGRPEIVDAVRSILRQGVSRDEVSEETIRQHLYWPDMSDPDLVIRTSGEQRLSNFLMWQSTYSELFWCQSHWPAFSEQDLDEALTAFSERQRRYGK